MSSSGPLILVYSDHSIIDLHRYALVLSIYFDAVVCYRLESLSIPNNHFVQGDGLMNFPKIITICSHWLRKRRNLCRRSITHNIELVRVHASYTPLQEEPTVSGHQLTDNLSINLLQIGRTEWRI